MVPNAFLIERYPDARARWAAWASTAHAEWSATLPDVPRPDPARTRPRPRPAHAANDVKTLWRPRARRRKIGDETMTHSYAPTRPSPVGPSRFGNRAVTACRAMIDALIRYRRRRGTIAALRALDDRALSDISVSRGVIDHVSAQACRDTPGWRRGGMSGRYF
jgi:uncharacterized protein YjiS (DUF1127 family)